MKEQLLISGSQPDDAVFEINPKVVWDRDKQDSPFYNYIGNDAAVETVYDVLKAGLKEPTRACPSISLAFYGPASCGKTTMMQLIANVLGLPHLLVNSADIKNTEVLLKLIVRVLKDECMELFTSKFVNGRQFCIIPPMVISFDEIQTLPYSCKEHLLSAFAKSTNRITGQTFEADCSKVWFIVATTERGSLSLPLQSRFTTVNFEPYTLKEVSEIVSRNTKWSKEHCDRVARFTGIPRVALDFVKLVKYFMDGNQNIPLPEAIKTIAQRQKIDEDGISDKQKTILKILYDKINTGESLDRLASALSCGPEEVKGFILPPLLVDRDDRKAFIFVSNRYKINKYGIAYVERKLTKSAR